MFKHGELIEETEEYKLYSVDEEKVEPFCYCCFDSVLLIDKRNDKIYIFEDIQDGEIWSDDEIYGTVIICLTDLWRYNLDYYTDEYIEKIDRITQKGIFDWDKEDLEKYDFRSIESYKKFIKEVIKIEI